MLITINRAYSGGPGAKALAERLEAASRGDDTGGKRWRPSKKRKPV